MGVDAPSLAGASGPEGELSRNHHPARASRIRYHEAMVAIISLLTVIMLSILVTRVATIALIHTGMTREAARFQARSAFTGAGFTTRESEQIVNHPVRRRIAMLLMLMGNAGIVTAVSSLILTFVGPREAEALSAKLLLLFGGLAILLFFANSAWVDRHLSRIIDRLLRRYTRLDVRDYASLMHLAGDYRLVELHVGADDWLANRTLKDAELRDEGLVVLGIRRDDGTYIGGPKGDSLIRPDDTLLVYGRIASVEELDCRSNDYSGDAQHRRKVREQADQGARDSG